ncbi:MAG: DUF721 domain-containing protein [Verrucomicrobiota bacterium]|nr:DUF721 domain-containing protein [Verrucomicrobiota bacterium]
MDAKYREIALQDLRGPTPKVKPYNVVPIGSMIQGVMKAWGLGEKAMQARIVKEWPQIVGPLFAQHTHPTGFIRKTLTVGVTHPAFHYEVRVQKPLWIQKINDRLGQVVIKEIIFRVGG